jgi:hypothetical protein
VVLRPAVLALLLATAGQASAEVDAGDAQEIVETLLGIDPARHATPLAAMQGWGELYARYRDAAAAGDAQALRVWLLIGQVALARADAGSVEAFSADLMPVYAAGPDAVLAALSENGWLVPSTCFYLGNWFGHEGRHAGDRPAFLAAEAPRIAAALHPRDARGCIGQIVSPARQAGG